MKVSIITATYNSSDTIAVCIASVNGQSYPDIEHIIVDGASTDNTIDIIRSMPNRVSQLISETDKGIYDALNKGIQLATGDVIGFLHSNDLYASNQTIEHIVQAFTEKSVKKDGSSRYIPGIYGDLVYFDSQDENKILRTWQSKPFRRRNIFLGFMPPHPTLFLRKEVYHKHGLFDTTFKISGDYDFLLRVMMDEKIRLEYLPGVVTKMRKGGASTGGIIQLLSKSYEDVRALRKNKLPNSFYILLSKNLRKVHQLFRR